MFRSISGISTQGRLLRPTVLFRGETQLTTTHLPPLCHISTHTHNRPVFVTTPIFYVNAIPHIGHAYSALLADVYARWHRMQGFEVLFCSGTDEHGSKVAEAAARNGKETRQFCDEIAAEFERMLQVLDVSVDDFVRTTDKRHIETVEWLWNRLKKNDAIVLGKHEGWYCQSDESFLTNQQVIDDDKTGTKISLESGHPVHWLSEPNYKFFTSKYRKEILEWLQRSPSPVLPFERSNEAIALVNRHDALPDLSVSRLRSKVDWAIPVPGDSEHSVYVWLDALANYLTVARAHSPDDKDGKWKAWPASCHVIGKDILKFHTVLWPAILAAANLECPEKVVVHAHWTVNKCKMSKSIGNVVSPFSLVNEIGIDAVRYFLLRDGGMANDGDFSESSLINIANKDLADVYGNLLRRSTAKLKCWPLNLDDTDLKEPELHRSLNQKLSNLPSQVDALYKSCEVGKAVKLIMGVLQDSNAYFAASEPWVLAKQIRVATKDGKGALDNTQVLEYQQQLDMIVYATLDSLRICSILLLPVVPGVAGKVLDTLGISVSERRFEDTSLGVISDNRLIQHGNVVFQKISETKAD